MLLLWLQSSTRCISSESDRHLVVQDRLHRVACRPLPPEPRQPAPGEQPHSTLPLITYLSYCRSLPFCFHVWTVLCCLQVILPASCEGLFLYCILCSHSSTFNSARGRYVSSSVQKVLLNKISIYFITLPYLEVINKRISELYADYFIPRAQANIFRFQF